MDEVATALIAIALVLSAVFIPTAFIPGLSGEFYRQFALTIAVSTIISTFLSLTLSPALAALLLKPHTADKSRFLPARLGGTLAGGFNRGFARMAGGYAKTIGSPSCWSDCGSTSPCHPMRRSSAPSTAPAASVCARASSSVISPHGDAAAQHRRREPRALRGSSALLLHKGRPVCS
jgi:hypothetical protein